MEDEEDAGDGVDSDENRRKKRRAAKNPELRDNRVKNLLAGSSKW